MLYLNNNATYTLKTNDNLQTVRPFPDPSFPFIINHLNMAQISMPYIPWHWHDEFELVLVKSGTLTITTSDGSFILKEDDGVFLNRGILHMIKTQANEDCDFFIIRFCDHLLFPDRNASITTNFLNPILVSTSLHHIHLISQNVSASRILQNMKQLIQIYYTNPSGNQLLILSSLYSLWFALYDYLNHLSSNTPLTTVSVADYNRVTDAIHYIAEHYADAITLEDIAGSIHLSKSECCRCFKRTVNLSPIEFLIQYRIMEAIRIMQKKEASANSISMLSASVGFNNASYFNKQFKRFTGYTPLEFRNNMLSDLKSPLSEKDFIEIFTSAPERE